MNNEDLHCSRGRISTMPGALAHTSQPCDKHPKRLAVKRVQGETDSYGCEYIHMCQVCLEAFQAYQAQPKPGCCDWCNKMADNLRAHRDLDEGTSGPVYRVCNACVNRESEAIAIELSENESIYFDDEYYDIY